MVLALNFLDLKEIADKLSTAPQYFKTVETELRLVQETEIGTVLVTYILKNHTIERETEKKIERGYVVARNSVALDPKKGIYNEWLIAIDELVKIYDIKNVHVLSHNFSKHMKIAQIRAIPITSEIIAIFNEAKAVEIKDDVPILHIMPPWGTEMKAFKNDFLTTGGYSISENDMKLYKESQTTTQSALCYSYQSPKSHCRSSSDSASTYGNLEPSTFESLSSSPLYHHRVLSTDSVSSVTSVSSTSSPIMRGRRSTSQSTFYSCFESPTGPNSLTKTSTEFSSFRLDDFNNDKDKDITPVDEQKKSRPYDLL
jgi:hypothetical protein